MRLQDSEARARARASPMPRVAPVMRATWPARREFLAERGDMRFLWSRHLIAGIGICKSSRRLLAYEARATWGTGRRHPNLLGASHFRRISYSVLTRPLAYARVS